MPTRRTSTLGFSEAVCASAAAATTTTHKLFLNRRMFLGYPNHFGPGILHLDLARNQAHESAADQHEPADPDPGNQRENIGLNDGALVVVGHAAKIQIQIF